MIYLKMLQGKELFVTAVGKIWFYKDIGKSECEIAQLMKHPKTTIHNAIIRKKIQIKLKNLEKKRISTAWDV